jgi:hypothetical protein
MQNQSPPNIGNSGELQAPFGQPPGQGQHPGMMPMQHGVPYPYVMYPMGAPYVYLPPHPDMGNHHHPEMQMEHPHFRGPMMQFPYGVPPPHMMPPMMGMHVPAGQMPQYIQPGGQMPRRESVNSAHSRTSEPSPPLKPAPAPAPAAVAVEKPAAPTPTKPVSRRLPIIDPTTGKEISFNPAPVSVPAIPASALTPVDVVLGTKDPQSPKKTPKDVSPPVIATPELVTPSESVPLTPARKPLMKLKNAPLAKPVKQPEIPSRPRTPLPEGMKQLKRIFNRPLTKKPTTAVTPASVETITPPLDASSTKAGGKFRLTNKAIAPTKMVIAAVIPTIWPVTRDMFMQYLPLARPDRYAPSSVNVFPSELLGLRTAPHGDPGLSRSSAGRRISLQKTMSAVSTGSGGASQWRSGNKLGGRTLSRQASSKGGRGNQIIRPSERGFKIIDQSSLSEKDKLRRQVMALLNKITVDSFSSITDRIAEIEITQPWQMDVVIGLIFDKAVAEHHYSELYADMCKRLRNTWPELTGVDAETGEAVPVTFTRAIIEKCQAEFDAMPDSLEATEEDIAKARGDPTDIEMFVTKKKNRILGNMKFIAQLFLMRILSSRTIRSVVEQLLFRTECPEEHYIECICILLHNIGGTLFQTESGKAYIEQFIERLEDLYEKDSYGKRIKFLMKDVIEAASQGWEGTHGGARMVTSAKSKEEARKDEKPAEISRTNSNRFPARPVSKPVAAPVTAVLSRRTNSYAAVAPQPLGRRDSIPEEEEEEDDEVSEYAPSSVDAEEDDLLPPEQPEVSDEEGFTRVERTKR